jgi:seryl-tRNA(Sec) selenium transferase
MAAQMSSAAENGGAVYTAYKQGKKVLVNGVSTAVTNPTAMATYIVQLAYDGDTGQGQRADLIQAIAHACALFKGTI